MAGSVWPEAPSFAVPQTSCSPLLPPAVCLPAALSGPELQPHPRVRTGVPWRLGRRAGLWLQWHPFLFTCSGDHIVGAGAAVRDSVAGVSTVSWPRADLARYLLDLQQLVPAVP